MKLKPLLFFPRGKTIPLFCFFLLISFFSFSQSETDDFITYDTTISYSCNTGADGCSVGGVPQAFSLRISRPRNYFSAGHPDTASRPWFVTMQGENQVGTDTSLLATYGPHYWLNNGWDGGLQLGNGKHYPILITIMGQAANVAGPFVQALMDTLYKYFHPKPNSVHMAGLSMGLQVLTNYLGYEKIAGDEHNMANVKSFVDLQGLGPDNIGADPMAYPAFFGHWAKKYGGTFFGLEGDSDSRNVWQITELMNDSVPGSAYFAYEHVGGALNHGRHCCWNSMYDPSVTNWQDIPPVTNPNIDPTYYLHPNTPGTYTVDPVTGTSIFQWMLRQGDTSLVGGGSAPPPPASQIFVAPGEYQVFFIDSSKHLYGVGSNLNTLGVGGSGLPGTTLALAFSPALKFKTAAGILHGGAAVDTAGNVWTWGDNDQGQAGNGTVTSSQVLTPVRIATDSAGNAFAGVTSLCSYYTGNTSQGWYAVKADSTLWVWGQTLGGMRGNGTAGSTSNTRPVQVPLPGGRKVWKIAAGNELIVLFSDSTVWTCGGSGGSPQNLGYAVSGTSYQSLQQLTTLTGIKDIAGGGPYNYALRSNGTLYGWGYYGYYMGGTGGGNSPLATPTDLTARLNLPHPITSIAVNMNCTHVILSDSTMWGWGDNAQGCIGNGQELDFSTTPDPYAWSYAPAQLLQQAPIQVTSRKDYVALFSNYSYVMYTYAETAGGQLYSWGRNKGAVLGNGIVGCTSDIVATYPNSWDITTPTSVTPLSITSTTVGPCPYCVTHPTTSPCNTCTTGSAVKPSTAIGTGARPDDARPLSEQLHLYPTLTHDNETLTMSLISNSLGSVRIRIVDMNGRVLRTLQTGKRSSYLNQTLPTGHLAAGVYIVQAVIGNDKQFTEKFIRE